MISGYDKFEDTKGYKSKDRQYNGQKKTDKRTNNDLQNARRKLKMEQHETPPHPHQTNAHVLWKGKQFLFH